MELKGSQTEKNLLIAFAGESQARNRYTYYAGEAKKAGYEYIAAIFLETAENEKEHAKVFFKHLGEGTAEIVAGYPFHLGDTLSNLIAAVEGEHFEWTTLYQNFAIVADQEGFKDIAASFREIAKVEHFHESRYQALAEHVRTAPCSSVAKRSPGTAATAATSSRARRPRNPALPASIPGPTTRCWRKITGKGSCGSGRRPAGNHAADRLFSWPSISATW